LCLGAGEEKYSGGSYDHNWYHGKGDAALDGHWRAMLPNVDGVILITKRHI
jgi:hypothetical protein